MAELTTIIDSCILDLTMALFQFNCPKCGEFDTLKSLSGDLSKTECPECKTESRRVWYAPNHYWQGMMAPLYNHEASAVRFKNNSKIYGEGKAGQIERNWRDRR
jgi:putative FmdB family regulatory protein